MFCPTFKKRPSKSFRCSASTNKGYYSSSCDGNRYSTSYWLLNFSSFIFPIVRRVFPNLISNDIISVQPMSIPTGSIFYLDYSYNED